MVSDKMLSGGVTPNGLSLGHSRFQRRETVSLVRLSATVIFLCSAAAHRQRAFARAPAAVAHPTTAVMTRNCNFFSVYYTDISFLFSRWLLLHSPLPLVESYCSRVVGLVLYTTNTNGLDTLNQVWIFVVARWIHSKVGTIDQL